MPLFRRIANPTYACGLAISFPCKTEVMPSFLRWVTGTYRILSVAIMLGSGSDILDTQDGDLKKKKRLIQQNCRVEKEVLSKCYNLVNYLPELFV